jgi:hypothetical protein
MMTSDRDATLGGVLDLPFVRPRDRHRVFKNDTLESLREHPLGFLEHQVRPTAAPEKCAPDAVPSCLHAAEHATS